MRNPPNITGLQRRIHHFIIRTNILVAEDNQVFKCVDSLIDSILKKSVLQALSLVIDEFHTEFIPRVRSSVYANLPHGITETGYDAKHIFIHAVQRNSKNLKTFI